MIYYFSATGNSQHVATRIAEALGTQAQSIETASTEIRLADREPLGFGCLHRCPKFAISYNNKTQSHGQYQHSKYYKKQ